MSDDDWPIEENESSSRLSGASPVTETNRRDILKGILSTPVVISAVPWLVGKTRGSGVLFTNPRFDDALNGWTTENPEGPGQTPGSVEYLGGSVKMQVDGAPSTIILSQTLNTDLPEGSEITVEIETGGNLSCCGGFSLYLSQDTECQSCGQREVLKHPRDGHHMATITANKDYEAGDRFEMRTSIWPGRGYTIVKELSWEYASEPTVEQVEISVDEAKLVQVTDRTRYSGTSAETTVSELIEGRRTSVVFSLSSPADLTEGLGEIPLSIQLSGVENSEIVSDGTPPYEFTINAESVPNIARTTPYPLPGDFEIPTNYPVFTLTSPVTVTGTIGEGNERVVTKEFSFELPNQRVQLQSADDAPTLKVGFTPVMDIYSDGKKYGEFDRQQYDEIVDSALKYLRNEFPTTDVIGFQYGRTAPEENAISADGELTAEGWYTRNILDEELPVTGATESGALKRQLEPNGRPDLLTGDDVEVTEFDVTVGIVPSGYVERITGETGVEGVHYGGEFEQPRIAALAEVDKGAVLVAHEIGHHLLGDLYGGDDIEGGDNHATQWYVSDSYDFETGEFSASLNSHSFMAEVFEGDYRMDAVAYNHLLESRLTPTPSEGSLNLKTVIRIFTQTEDYGVIRTKKTDRGRTLPPSESEDGVTAEVTDQRGNLITSASLTDGISGVFAQSDETQHSPVVEGHVELPDDAYQIDIRADGKRVNSFSPVSGLLFTAVESLPDDAFQHPQKQRRKALNSKLSVVERQLDQKTFRGAEQKLENDIRQKLVKWLDDDYAASAEQYTKQEILELADEMTARIGSLAENAR